MYYLTKSICARGLLSSGKLFEQHVPIRTLTNLDKRILVWTGKFKTLAEVPESVSSETLKHAKSKFRIKMSNYSIIFCFATCLVVALQSRRRALAGENLQKINLEKRAKEKAESLAGNQ